MAKDKTDTLATIKLWRGPSELAKAQEAAARMRAIEEQHAGRLVELRIGTALIRTTNPEKWAQYAQDKAAELRPNVVQRRPRRGGTDSEIDSLNIWMP